MPRVSKTKPEKDSFNVAKNKRMPSASKTKGDDNMSFIRFENVTKEYVSGDSIIKALDGADFEIEKGKFTVILGPSGSGKSTTLNLLGGMDFCTRGRIFVGDDEITKFNEARLTEYRRNKIGFVFQFYNLIPNLTAFENVDIALKLTSSDITATEALEAVGLSHRMGNFPSQLSGGELQRVSIARAICKNPQIMLCDEPTGALDSETGKKILTLLQSMAKTYDTAVIVVTHNAGIVPAADKVVRLRDGRIEGVETNDFPLMMEEVEW